MNKEYEYSFKVKKIMILFIIVYKINIKKIEDYIQIRTLYKNGGNIMARITKNIYEDRIIDINNIIGDES